VAQRKSSGNTSGYMEAGPPARMDSHDTDAHEVLLLTVS